MIADIDSDAGLGYRANSETHCPACGCQSPLIFMVHDHVFQSAKLPLGSRQAGYWCIGCFEERLGRSVAAKDLKPGVLCNEYFFARLS